MKKNRKWKKGDWIRLTGSEWAEPGTSDWKPERGQIVTLDYVSKTDYIRFPYRGSFFYKDRPLPWHIYPSKNALWGGELVQKEDFINRAVNDKLTKTEKKLLPKIQKKLNQPKLYLLIVDKLKDLTDPKMIIVGVFDTEAKAWEHAKNDGYKTRSTKRYKISVCPLVYYKKE